jgi:hypothetical protein
MTNMYMPARSGDLEVVPQSAQLDEFLKGTTHGTPYAYDTHIPLIWYGWKVKKGKDYSAVEHDRYFQNFSCSIKYSATKWLCRKSNRRII